MLDNLRKAMLALAVAFSAGLLFVNVYNSVVDAANWGGNVPVSIEAMRGYFKTSNPGVFFRVASPINQLLALITLILFWKVDKRLRLVCAIAFLVAVGNDIFTFAYFYPRNAILAHGPLGDTDTLKATVSQWATMNWIRSLVGVVGLALNFAALFLFMVRTPAPAALRLSETAA